MAETIQKSLIEFAQTQEAKGESAVLLVSPKLRRMLSKLVQMCAAQVFVLAYNEIPDQKQVKIIQTLGQGN